MNQQQLKENLSYLDHIKTCIDTFNGFYHDNKFIDFIIEKINNEIKKNKSKIDELNDNDYWSNWNRNNNIYWGWDDKFLNNNEKFNSGYISDIDDDESFSNYDDDDTSCNSDEMYDKLIENNWNDDWQKKNILPTIFEKEEEEKNDDNDLKNKYECIGIKSFNFHRVMNDHHLHYNCDRCNRNCDKNKYICGATIPVFESINKYGHITQYKKCGYVCKDIEDCVHNCKGLYLKEKYTIIRFNLGKFKKGANFFDKFFIFKLNKYNNM